MSSLNLLTNWKAGVSFLLTIALAIWLNPLPIGALLIVFAALFAAVHLLAATITAINQALRRKHDRNL